MKTKILLLGILISVAINSYSQDFWDTIPTKGLENIGINTFVVDVNGYIYIGGNTNNAIARTKDDGKTWNVLYSNESLKQVTSININNRGNIFAANIGVEGLVASFEMATHGRL